MARIHERLYRTADIGTVDLASYLADICEDLAGLAPQCEVKYEPAGPIPIATDRAVRVALLLTELMTNAAKACLSRGQAGTRKLCDWSALTKRPSGWPCKIKEKVCQQHFDIERSGGLGLKIVRALLTQTGATLSIHRHQPGSEFVIDFPIQADVPAG